MTNFSNFAKFNSLYRELKNLNISKEEFEIFEKLTKSLQYTSHNSIETNKHLDLSGIGRGFKHNDESLAEFVNNNKDIFENAEAITLDYHEITNVDCLSICKNLRYINLEYNEKLTNLDGLNACKNIEKVRK